LQLKLQLQAAELHRETATDLILESSSDSLSSPFVEYDADLAYIGNDTGTLCRVKEVFSTVHPECTGLNPPVPSLDTTWAPAGALAAGCSGKLTSLVVAGTGDIFVGCSDEKLYGFTPSGGLIAGSPLSVGEGTTTVNGNVGGIVDPPLVDVVNVFRCAMGVSTSPSTLYSE
jgi:hypothetical protein